jgi:phenylpropionate dioxygenase-like ring-hydroxylating dioxygenase large terminal subunit
MPRTNDAVALDDWYVIAHTSEIKAGEAERTVLLGQDLTVSRDRAGVVRCVAHGAAGEETAVPIAERYSFLWVTLGSPKRDIVAMAEFEDTERRLIYRGRIGLPTSGQRVIENFFDLSHFSFVHTGTLGGLESAEVPQYAVEFREDRSELWATGCSFLQPKASVAAGLSANVRYDYRIPSPFVAIIYKDCIERPGCKDLIGLFLQPHEEERCTVHSFALLYDDRNSGTHILHFYHEIFAQDRSILIHQRPKKLPIHPRREIPTLSDASSIAYRRWLDKSGLQFGLERTPA